jgi:hypothetical protein
LDLLGCSTEETTIFLVRSVVRLSWKKWPKLVRHSVDFFLGIAPARVQKVAEIGSRKAPARGITILRKNDMKYRRNETDVDAVKTMLVCCRHRRRQWRWWWLIFLLFISLASVVKCSPSGGPAEDGHHRSARHHHHHSAVVVVVPQHQVRPAVEEQRGSASPGDRLARRRNKPKKQKKKQKQIDAYLAQLHADADLDSDGHLSFTECYARILLFYLYLNRQADLEPPTRSDLAVLYDRAGWDHTGSRNKKGLNADEFTRLAKTLLSRAASRLLVHKIVTIALAPYVALSIVHALDDVVDDDDSRRRSWWGKVMVARLRDHRLWHHPYRHHLPSWMYQPLTKRSFWVSICMVLCIKLLPHLAISLMDYFFDADHSPFVRRYLDLRPPPSISTDDDDQDNHNDEIMTTTRTTTTTVDRNGSATAVTVD